MTDRAALLLGAESLRNYANNWHEDYVLLRHAGGGKSDQAIRLKANRDTCREAARRLRELARKA